MSTPALAFDAASVRRVDANGFLHVASSHITKATVNPYYGREIPGWQEAGLDPERIYYGFRAPEELRRSLPTWEGLPLHIEHHIDSADEPRKLTRVGAVGKAVWNAPYVDAPLTVWDRAVIDAIEDDSFRELSCAYRYDPDFTPGRYEGIEYDFIMRDIRGNHVALVEEGRAGPDVVVADAALWGEDAAFEESKHPRDKDGKFGKGSRESGKEQGGASGSEISLTGRELGDYRDVKELRQKAVAWYKEHLQGRPAYRDDIGEIRFSRKGRDEMEAYSANPDKLLMVPALRNIIETGKLGEEEKLKHPRRDGMVAFVPVTKKVNFKGESREVEVLLGKDKNGNLYYDLFLDGARQEGKKKSPTRNPEQIQGAPGTTRPASGVGNKPTVGGDSTGFQPAVALNIVIKPVRVNLQTGVDASRHPKHVAIMADAALWGEDAAFEESKHPRDKDGKFGKGSRESGKEQGGASGSEISLTGRELGDYRDVKELRQKAVAWYKEHLQGKPAHRDDIGEIRFSRKGRGETFSFSVNPDKLLMIPALRDIIETGELGKEEALNHPRKDGIVAFIPVTKTVKLRGRLQKVEVLLGRDENGNLYYDMFLEQRKNPLTVTGSHNPRLSGDSTAGMQPAVALNIVIKPVRVNLQTGVDASRHPKHVAIMADAALWGEDAAFEESKHPRDKDGKFGKGEGAGGNGTPASGKEISLSGNELGSYRDMKELRQKAVDYYKTHLQGKPAHRDDIGEIRFSRKGMSEAKNFSADANKLLMFPALRGIIETGERGKEEKPNHPRKDGIVAFIPITKTVNIKGNPQDVEVLLGKDAQGNVYYDLFLNNQRQQKSLARNQVQNPGLARDTAGMQPVVDLNIVIKPVRVNLQTGVDASRHPKHVAVMADAALWGEDAEEWRTAKNGKKYQIETETGEVLKGNLGRKAGSGYQSRPLESATPDTARYEALLKEQGGDAKKAAHEYFREKLQGRHVEAQTATGPIRACFTGGSWGELKKDMRDDPVKASLVPHLPDIITTGRYAPETPAHAHPEVTQFHTYRKTVQTSAGPKEAIVDVAERPEKQPEHQVYSLTREGSHAYEKRQKEAASSPVAPGQNRGTRKTPTQDSNAAAENSVVPLFEVVNVRLAGSERPALVGDGNITKTRQSNPFTGAVMKIKHWFRGARDADPGIERQEVDLAQAIIDLHKVDPETGEIVDITEDEDKAAEIRKLIGELSGKLDPAEVKRLTDALSDLAYSKATGDAEPDNRSFAEGVNYGERLERNSAERRKLDREHESKGMKRAMDKCGLDADDEDAAKAFAEGVKYGEESMRNPAKREKLDREHEAEGMRKAMDSCGLDAENPQESRAFAEGVKYGERLERNPEERGKLDREHESKGIKRAMGKDEDKNAAIERILAAVPGLTPEQQEKLRNSLADLAYFPATGDADPDADPSAAQDRALCRLKPAGPRPLLATDAALIQARAVAAAQDNMRAIARAVADVRPLVGELDLLAFDSASDVYGYALEQSGVNPRQYARQAWRGMVDVLRSQKSGLPSGRRLAQDAAPRKLDGQFAGLNTISIGD